MKKLTITILIACLVIAGLTSPSQADPGPDGMVTMDEALTVANNWITLIIQKKGSWGGSETAEVREIQEFKRGERILGYYSHVKPDGFIVTSLRKELAPVKAYSTLCGLDPESDEGMVDLIKGSMERILDAIEDQIGPLVSVRTEDLEDLLEINYRPAWEELGSNVEIFRSELELGAVVMDYQEGDVLLTSAWHQGDPYNALTPAGDAACADCCPLNPLVCPPTPPTLVGCVALAGAQIMNYWSWPPYGVGNPSYTWDGDDSCNGPVGGGPLNVTVSDTYDWPNMANEYEWDDWQNRWEDENGDPLTQAHLDAVAELCYEIGVAVEMDYGVCLSEAWTHEMEGVYEQHYRYSTACARRNRSDYSAVDWFNRMKTQFNANRPVQYRIPGHSLVSDGWQEIGGLPTRQYHMNYGWGPDEVCGGHPCNFWYTLDALHGGLPAEEYMLENIYPAQALGSLISNTYIREPFPFRYFDRDATGDSATFESGQNLQFLPGITLRCTGGAGEAIRFHGPSTLLFTRGDQSRGIRIYNGTVRLNRGGSLRFE